MSSEAELRVLVASRRETLGDKHPDTLTSINNMGELLHDLGKFNEAEPLFCEALAGFRETLGDRHPETLTSIHSMAMLLKAKGKLAEADMLLREALAGSRDTLGDKHPSTLMCINARAHLLYRQGNWLRQCRYCVKRWWCIGRHWGTSTRTR